MWDGKVESIFIAHDAKAAMQAVTEVRAVPGSGLEGDRYFLKQGTFFKPEPDFELTLIEAEALEAMQQEYQIVVAPSESRRNVVTRGVPLNHLVGKEFEIAESGFAASGCASRAVICRNLPIAKSSRACVIEADYGHRY